MNIDSAVDCSVMGQDSHNFILVLLTKSNVLLCTFAAESLKTLGEIRYTVARDGENQLADYQLSTSSN